MSKVKVQKVPTTGDRKLPVFKEVEKLMERMRNRAYDLFCERGFSIGHDLEDWLRAEDEICWSAAGLVATDNGYRLEVALA